MSSWTVSFENVGCEMKCWERGPFSRRPSDEDLLIDIESTIKPKPKDISISWLGEMGNAINHTGYIFSGHCRIGTVEVYRQ